LKHNFQHSNTLSGFKEWCELYPNFFEAPKDPEYKVREYNFVKIYMEIGSVTMEKVTGNKKPFCVVSLCKYNEAMQTFETLGTELKENLENSLFYEDIKDYKERKELI